MLIDRLDRKQLLRRSSILGENQLRFAHALIRDVASQLTRIERARRHEAAAARIGSRPERVDTAELIAHH